MTKTTETGKRSADEMIDAMLEEYGTSREAVLGKQGIWEMLKKRLVERALAGELTHHLGYPPGVKPEGAQNQRNGYSKKTVLGEEGAMEIAVPRDRAGSFEPLIIAKGQRRFEGFDEKIIAMYARGMTVREIRGFLLDQYGVDVGADFISTVTDAVVEEVQEWQNRPLERMYPVVFFDALRVKIRDEGTVKNKAVYLGAGSRSGREPGCAGNMDRAERGSEVLAEGHERSEEPRGGGHPDCSGGWAQGVSGSDWDGFSGGAGANLHCASDALQPEFLRVERAQGGGAGVAEYLPGGKRGDGKAEARGV